MSSFKQERMSIVVINIQIHIPQIESLAPKHTWAHILAPRVSLKEDRHYYSGT